MPRTVINKEFFGLATGTFLTLRCTSRTEGPIGSIRQCAVCHVPGTQIHFLNSCSLNLEPRQMLMKGVPNGVRICALTDGNFALFFEQVRRLEIEAPGVEVTEEALESFAKVVMLASAAFVVRTLSGNPSHQTAQNVTIRDAEAPRGIKLRISSEKGLISTESD